MSDVEPTDLLGRWRFTRELRDRDQGDGTAVGLLVLAEVNGRVTWTETGTLSWNGQRIDVSRLMRLRRHTDGWSAHFADGSLFHRWAPGTDVRHLCGRDVYDGLIDVTPDLNSMRVRWLVSGSKKDQRIESHYRREHGPDVPGRLASGSGDGRVDL